jgi:hypothetical protein
MINNSNKKTWTTKKLQQHLSKEVKKKLQDSVKQWEDKWLKKNIKK